MAGYLPIYILFHSTISNIVLHNSNINFMIKQITTFFSLGLMCLSFSFAQTLINVKLGDKFTDVANAGVQTPMGDYLIVGQYEQPAATGKKDLWILRLDKYGKEVWEKHMGGANTHELANDVIMTKEGDFVVAGLVNEKQPNGDAIVSKAWIIKLDPKGNVKWEAKFGNGKGELAKSIVQTPDGGFAFVGMSKSNPKGGKLDGFIVRIDPNGKLLWQKYFGGIYEDRLNTICNSKYGGFIIGGVKSKNQNDADSYIARLDDKGTVIWEKTYGRNSTETEKANEEVLSVLETPDGRVVASGWAKTTNRMQDALVMMLSKDGTQLWEKQYGKAGNDGFNSVTKTTEDNTFLAVGFTTPKSATEGGLWVVKFDDKGNLLWDKSTSNDREESANCVSPLKDGGFLVVGKSENQSAGDADAWVLTMTSMGTINNPQPAIEPQPAIVKPTPPKPGPKENPNDIFKPNLYILTVGVSRYEDDNYNLHFAHTDADSIAEAFATMKGKIFNKVEVKKLLNEEATGKNIKMAISWLEQQATQKDMIIMFFSSHGALDNKGNLYILPHDFSPMSLFATALNIKDITSGTNAAPCKKLIFMDACHSGQSGNDLLEFASLKDASIDNVVKEIASAEPGVTIMTSSTGKEYSYEKTAWGHGAFSKAILEGLKGSADFNKDKVINFSELNLYVSERVKELTKGKQHPYTPINLSGNIPIYILN